ncbi:enoyl-CoA hydratase-related protein [Halobacteriovorax sp. GFR7]|uniref:enoyl-CoA hydratase-related protein n=1 Tax=unclassified Halobacteriovorax TaxID=2639665 RepID=UPI003D99C999
MSIYAYEFEHLKIEKKDAALWVSLDNTKMANAITNKMIASLTEVLTFADGDPDIRVIVLKGEGDNFCAGGDIKAMVARKGMFAGESFELRNRYSKGIQNIPRVIERLQKPIIAMVHGGAIGAGCDLVAMCDLAVASDDAKFGETFCKLSLVPGDGGPYFLTRKVGYTKAMEMYLTGRIYTAKEAMQMGLVNNIVTGEDLELAVTAFANEISANAPVAVQLTKTAMKRAAHDDLESHLNLMSAYQGIAQRTNDHFEGLSALKEKRNPDFKGN